MGWRTVAEAASIEGVKENAIRQRVRRGKLSSQRGDNGLRYVWLTEESAQKDARSGAGTDTELVDELRRQIQYLQGQVEVWQEESRRKDTILYELARSTPELEAAQEHSEPHQDTRPWWKRLLGLR